MQASLNIERLTVGCRVPRLVADDARRTKDLLDRILSSATQELPGCLRRALASEPGSDAIAFIDTLQVDVTIDTAWPQDEIARAVAVQLLRGLWRRLEGPDTIRFKDRAELLARFILDLAHGAGYRQRWHRRFDGLRPLSTSGIVRTLIVDEPLAAGAALTRLLPADLQKVTALLTESDAERALAAITSTAQDGFKADPVVVATTIISQSCWSLQKPQQQLAFAIAMLRVAGVPADAGTVILARRLVQLARSEEPGGRLPQPDEASLAEAVRILSGELPCDQGSEQLSSCGGIWLLLPHVLTLLHHDLKLAPIALGALALAAGDDALNVWRDGLLQTTLGLDEGESSSLPDCAGPASTIITEERTPPHPYSIRRRNVAHLRRGIALLAPACPQARATARIAYAALSAYARRLPGFADSSFAYLWENFLATAATVRAHAGAIEVTLAPPPLDVIWKISGADRAAYVLPNGRNVRVGVRR